MSQRIYRYSCCCAGGSRSGLLVAQSRAQALEAAGAGGALVWDLRPLRLRGRAAPAARLAPEALESMTWRLGASLAQGVPLSAALLQLLEAEKSPAAAGLLARLWWRTQSGASLSEAMAEMGDVFAPWYRATLAAADATGTLAALMQSLAGLLRDFAGIRRQLRAGLAYPLLLLAVGSLICLGMLVEVVPRFAELLGDRASGQALLLIAASSWVRGLQPWDALVAIPALAALAVLAMRLAPLLQHVPPLRGWMRELSLARCSGVLAALLEAGVPLERALRLAAPCAPHAPVRQSLRKVAAAVAQGWPVEQALAAAPLPRAWAQGCSGSQDAGALAAGFGRLAQWHGQSVQVGAQRAQKLVEPAMVLLFGGILGGIMLLLYAPVLSLGASL